MGRPIASWIEEAKRMKDKGLSYVRIGQLLGVNHTTVLYNLDPEFRERKKTRMRERQKQIDLGMYNARRRELYQKKPPAEKKAFNMAKPKKKPTQLIRYAGYDPSEQPMGICKREW
jgi:hypothetical protein